MDSNIDDMTPLMGDLSRFSATNDLPELLETVRAQKEVVAINKRLGLLYAEIAKLEDRRRQLRRIISSVRSLPREVLSRIFCNVVSDGGSSMDEIGRKKVQALGLVSRSWRQAALATHEIWSDITIDHRDTAYGKINQWLSRSGILPKNVTYKGGSCPCHLFDRDGRRRPCQMESQGLITLLTSVPTLHRLEIVASFPRCVCGFLDKVHSRARDGASIPFDALQSLEIYIHDPEEWEGISLFSRLPKVTQLMLWIPPSGTVRRSSIPQAVPSPHHLNNITSLTFACKGETIPLMAVLVHCTDIEVLKVYCQDLRFHYADLSPNRLTLPRLHTLSLHQVQDLSILEVIRTPALRNLHMSCLKPSIGGMRDNWYGPSDTPMEPDPWVTDSFEPQTATIICYHYAW